MRIKTDSVKFCDPLYELSVFRIKKKTSVYDSFLGEEDSRESLYDEIFKTYEMSRANFLKQAALCWLVFPSATHTRFAHAIGTWTLGCYALDQVWVQHSKNSLDKLGEWLDTPGKRKWKESFLVSLLVHDIGHLPFSHVMESNKSLESGKTPDHEELTMDLIGGTGDFYKRVKAESERLGLKTIADVLKEHDDQVDVGLILGLLGESEDMEVKTLAELVHGAIDLDRVDHYNRDSYFMGLKLANTNVKGLMENIVLNVKNGTVCILEDGETDVLELLLARNALWKRALSNDTIAAYACMLNNAVSAAVKNGFDAKEIWFFTDEALLAELRNNSASQQLAVQIYTKQPYKVVYKECIEATTSTDEFMTGFGKLLKTAGFNDFDFLLFMPAQFEKGLQSKGWLSPIEVEVDGKRATLQSRHRGLLDYFEKEDIERDRMLRIFAKNADLAAQFEERQLGKEIDALIDSCQ